MPHKLGTNSKKIDMTENGIFWPKKESKNLNFGEIKDL